MSAFVVNEKTVNNAVTAFILIDRNYAKNEQTLLKDLWAMNIEAVNQRYHLKDSAKEDLKMEYLSYIKSLEEIKRKISSRDLYQLYSSCRCLYYQCSEGDVPEKSLYKTLEKVILGLARNILTENKVKETSKLSKEEILDIASSITDEHDVSWD